LLGVDIVAMNSDEVRRTMHRAMRMAAVVNLPRGALSPMPKRSVSAGAV
jgi:hypothetical protein